MSAHNHKRNTETNGIGGEIFLWIGGFVRFIYGTLTRKTGISDTPYYSLKEYLHGSEKPEDEHWDRGASHRFVNQLVGVITIVVLLWAISYLDNLF